jgi:hypothetical protein
VRASSGVSSRLATPRTPSVPKSRRGGAEVPPAVGAITASRTAGASGRP